MYVHAHRYALDCERPNLANNMLPDAIDAET
jgi:hypothetical protein